MEKAGCGVAWAAWREKANQLRRSADALLFPRAACCLCCENPRRAEWTDCLCAACREKLSALRVPASACNRCLSPISRGKPCFFCASPMMDAIEAVFAPYRYGGEVRQIITRFKFNACGEGAPLLARAMADSLAGRDFDCVAPVPLHPRRLRQRGFNQSLLLCREISQRTGIPVRQPLRRDVYHSPQSRAPLDRRAENVKNAFSCTESLRGQRVLLVDDVRTSGSTAASCARVLLQAGAESVCLCAAAVVYRKTGRAAGPEE